MKVTSIGIISGMAGKLDKSEKIVFSNRYGNIHAWHAKDPSGEPSALQLANRAVFVEAMALAVADMEDSEKAAEWLAVARSSRGKWKTARGAAFSSHYASLKAEENSSSQS